MEWCSTRSTFHQYVQLGTVHQPRSFSIARVLQKLLDEYPTGEIAFETRTHDVFPVHGIVISYKGPKSPTSTEAAMDAWLESFGERLRSITEDNLKKASDSLDQNAWTLFRFPWDDREACKLAFCNGE